MKILVLAIGRLKEDYWKAAEAEYLKRLRRFADVEVREVKDEAALVKALPARRRTILLDERGECWTSDELAERLVALEEQHGGGRTLVLVIGGAEGVSPALRQEADQAIAFGRITLPHRFARVLLVEQLYRAFSILRGEPYHK
ncbi:MAG: 23S rRNA (pseudouridine(1915)-N(3))-methyltransferase RlmH [Deltaproteobacteria bacterium]|nr:23S rRNA (pseudouridine(1915)-N(3))-methyltransferase RlmH [Deltaproteobacteria bacterium]